MHNESAQGAARPTRKVNETESAAFEKQLKEFERLFDQQPSLVETEEDTFYLVSVRFINTWRDFCLSQEQERELPLVMNEDLLQPGTQRLRPNLVEKENFEIVSEDVWASFGEFRANEIKRGVVTLGTERRVPIYLDEYRYLSLTAKQAKDMGRKKAELKVVEESENATVEQLSKKIMQIQELELTHEGRLWRVDEAQSVETFLEHVQRAVAKSYSVISMRIKGFGKKLASTLRLQQAQAGSGWLVLQVRTKGSKWFLEAEGDKQCESCYDITELRFLCKCNNAAYCSEKCREKDKQFHMRRCEFAEMEEFSRNFRMEIGEGSRRGKVGLRNLGNTCFMNSCLQCLSNTRPLTDYFLQRLFEPEINRTNLLGTKGKLARCYAMFIKAMWCERESVHSPDHIKSAVSHINPMFSGYAQHDSQEFFSFLIDGLHEDLNRVEKKPYVQAIESAGRSDAEVAAESWMGHIKRNQSIITDLMTGQYKSKVTCPTCQRESITFDPFITVTLPISERPNNHFECFVFSHNFQERTRKISFSYGKPNLAEWKQNIAKITGMQANALQVWLITIFEGIYLAGRDSLSDIIFKMENENKNIFVFEMSEQEQRMVDPLHLTVRFAKKAHFHTSEYENAWFKFPLMAERAATGLSLTQRILQLLYRSAYTRRNSTDYPAFEAMMLQKRPFQLVLRYQRKVDKHYSRLEYRYTSERIVEDETALQQLSEAMKDGEYELDVRFTEAGLSIFELKELKDYEDCANKRGSGRDWEGSGTAVELRDCFNNLSEEEELQRGNEWYCPSCKEHKQARKIIQIYKAPKVLILHLKRFKNKGQYRKEKNETRVHFPQVLDMSPFLIDHAPMASYGTLAADKLILIAPKHNRTHNIPCSERPIYDLYAVSNHYGGLGGGHYTAYGKNGEQWFDFNDSSVREVSRESIQGSSAYILFYKRRDE